MNQDLAFYFRVTLLHDHDILGVCVYVHAPVKEDDVT